MATVTLSLIVIQEPGLGGTELLLEPEATRFLDGTGLSYEFVPVTSTTPTAGTSRRSPSVLRPFAEKVGFAEEVRRRVLEARGEVIALVTCSTGIEWERVGAALAMLKAESAECVIGQVKRPQRLLASLASWLTRLFLSPSMANDSVFFAFSALTARRLFTESKLTADGIEVEVIFLANKYGYRVVNLPLGETASRIGGSPGLLRLCMAIIRVRLMNRRMQYRQPQRCPVCFSTAVWSAAQTASHILRNCKRCRCTYLIPPAVVGTSFDKLRTAFAAGDAEAGDQSAGPLWQLSRIRNTAKRAALLRRTVPAGARLLDIGAESGELGSALSGHFDYIALESSIESSRSTRALGVESYCSELESFVNVGPAFDAVSCFNTFGKLADPHAALARLKDLMKPGGILILVSADTESLTWSLEGVTALHRCFPDHLVLYSHSSLIELLEHSGFEIVAAVSQWEFRPSLEIGSPGLRASRLLQPVGRFFSLVNIPLVQCPSGSIRIVARRRAGSPLNLRHIRTAEPTHAR